MTSQEEDTDEEYLDDPIKLIDLEEARFLAEAEKSRLTLHQLYREDFDAADSDGEVYIEKEKAAPLGSFAVTLPVTFFDYSRNVALLNECKPLLIKIVDLKKFPWYYKTVARLDKNIITIDEDNDKAVSKEKELKEGIEKDLEMTKDDAGKPKIRPVDVSAYGHQHKHKKPPLLSPQRKCSVEEKYQRVFSTNSSVVDFKKNVGLVGLKITQTGDLKTIKKTLEYGEPRNDSTRPNVVKNSLDSMTLSRVSDAKTTPILQNPLNKYTSREANIKLVNDTVKSSFNNFEKIPPADDGHRSVQSEKNKSLVQSMVSGLNSSSAQNASPVNNMSSAQNMSLGQNTTLTQNSSSIQNRLPIGLTIASVKSASPVKNVSSAKNMSSGQNLTLTQNTSSIQNRLPPGLTIASVKSASPVQNKSSAQNMVSAKINRNRPSIQDKPQVQSTSSNHNASSLLHISSEKDKCNVSKTVNNGANKVSAKVNESIAKNCGQNAPKLIGQVVKYRSLDALCVSGEEIAKPLSDCESGTNKLDGRDPESNVNKPQNVAEMMKKISSKAKKGKKKKRNEKKITTSENLKKLNAVLNVIKDINSSNLEAVAENAIKYRNIESEAKSDTSVNSKKSNAPHNFGKNITCKSKKVLTEKNPEKLFESKAINNDLVKPVKTCGAQKIINVNTSEKHIKSEDHVLMKPVKTYGAQKIKNVKTSEKRIKSEDQAVTNSSINVGDGHNIGNATSTEDWKIDTKDSHETLICNKMPSKISTMNSTACLEPPVNAPMSTFKSASFRAPNASNSKHLKTTHSDNPVITGTPSQISMHLNSNDGARRATVQNEVTKESSVVQKVPVPSARHFNLPTVVQQTPSLNAKNANDTSTNITDLSTPNHKVPVFLDAIVNPPSSEHFRVPKAETSKRKSHNLTWHNPQLGYLTNQQMNRSGACNEFKALPVNNMTTNSERMNHINEINLKHGPQNPVDVKNDLKNRLVVINQANPQQKYIVAKPNKPAGSNNASAVISNLQQRPQMNFQNQGQPIETFMGRRRPENGGSIGPFQMQLSGSVCLPTPQLPPLPHVPPQNYIQNAPINNVLPQSLVDNMQQLMDKFGVYNGPHQFLPHNNVPQNMGLYGIPNDGRQVHEPIIHVQNNMNRTAPFNNMPKNMDCYGPANSGPQRCTPGLNVSQIMNNVPLQRCSPLNHAPQHVGPFAPDINGPPLFATIRDVPQNRVEENRFYDPYSPNRLNEAWPYNWSLQPPPPPPAPMGPTNPPALRPIKSNAQISLSKTPPVPPENNSSIIGRNNSGVVRKINIVAAPCMPPNNQPPTNVGSFSNNSDDKPANSKSEMLEELSKVTVDIPSKPANSKTEMLEELSKVTLDMPSLSPTYNVSTGVSKPGFNSASAEAETSKQTKPVQKVQAATVSANALNKGHTMNNNSPELKGITQKESPKRSVSISPKQTNNSLKRPLSVMETQNYLPSAPVLVDPRIRKENCNELQKPPTSDLKNKPGPLSKKRKLDLPPSPILSLPKDKRDKLVEPVIHTGYSPPILPILTYEKTLEYISQVLPADTRCIAERDSGAKFEKNVDESKQSVKKISLDEYKKRAGANSDRSEKDGNDKTEKGCSQKRNAYNSDSTKKADDVNLDLGYDSDSTVML